MHGGIGTSLYDNRCFLGPFSIQLYSSFNHEAFRVSGNNIMHNCGINNYHSLCGSEASKFTTDVAVHDDDDNNGTLKAHD